MRSDANEGTRATDWNRLLESDGMTMIGVDGPTRRALVARVRDDVAAGRYRPPADAVAERLLAFLGPAWSG